MASAEKQRLISFLQKSIKEKEKAIREKESDLECPVCLETVGGPATGDDSDCDGLYDDVQVTNLWNF